MIRTVAILLTALTGFSGLVYEVVWQKYLWTLLGSHAEATAAVLAIFLGGLSVGYALFGALTRRMSGAGGSNRHLLALYGVLEVAIGLHAFAFPVLFGVAGALSLAIPEGLHGGAFAWDLLFTALLIGPPTVLMGGTIPILTQTLARSLSDATRVHALIYATNTAGAFLGALLAGYLLVPRFGLATVIHAMAVLNVGAGLAFVVLSLRTVDQPALPGAAPAAPVHTGIASFALAAGLVGFSAMALQTVLIRVAALSLGSSQFTFAMTVAVFVLCIALGSYGVSALVRIRDSTVLVVLLALVAAWIVLYLQLDDAPYWAHLLRSGFREADADFTPYQLSVFAAALAVLALPVGLSGATVPLLFHRLKGQVGELGSAAGRLYAWNTVGSLLGSLLGGYWLLFFLDLHHVYRVGAGAVAVAALVLAARSPRAVRNPAAALAALALLVLALLPPWDPELLSSGLFRQRQPVATAAGGAQELIAQLNPGVRVVSYVDDPTTTVAVREAEVGAGEITRSISTNGKPDGSLAVDYQTMALAALLPALLADGCERAFVIGWGTGVTVGELAELECSREVTVAEVSPGVLAAAPLFDFGNRQASQSPKVHMVTSDAYRALLRAEGRFDIIVSEPSNPWVSGVEMLFSREFLTAARERLAPGGRHVQWLHLYESDRGVVQLILDTYVAVFPEVSVWSSQQADLLLVGSLGGADDIARIERRVARPGVRAALRRAKIPDLASLLAHELLPAGVLRAQDRGERPLHTLFHPRLADRAGRAFFTGARAGLAAPRHAEAAERAVSNSLLGRWLAGFDAVVPPDVWVTLARESCGWGRRGCEAVLARWLLDVERSATRDRILDRRGGAAAREAMEALARTFAPGTGPEETASLDSPEAAARATRRFIEHYHLGSHREGRAK